MSKSVQLDRFWDAWLKHRAGNAERPDFTEFARSSVHDPDYRNLLRELLYIDIENRQQLGEKPCVEDYEEACGKELALVEKILRTVCQPEAEDATEGLATEGIEDKKTVVQSSTLKVRCPHCHNPFELSAESNDKDVECPACGSFFSLASFQSTVSYQRDVPKKVGHFELIEQVGIGSFGYVWKARDTQLDRTVAVKIPRKDQLDVNETEQFLREARAGAQVKHPNVVGVHEVGREDDTIYIATDFVDGATLSDWLTDQRLGCKEAVELCVTVADALHTAHESGVVHRDLKPGNIMLDLDGVPYITDFGLAKRETSEVTMTVDGRVLGTPAYMSPEQARGKAHEADRRSDIYSLGVILYQLLTGELPFRGEPRMLIVQILRNQPTSPRKLNSRIPHDLETICLKCLEKDPNRRYQTAAELMEDLNRYLNGQSILARPVGAIGRLWRWYRCNPEATVRVAGGYATACSTVLILWALQGLALYGLGIDRSPDASQAMGQIAMLTVGLYLPMLWTGIQVLNGHTFYLWMSFATFLLGLLLVLPGLFGILSFAGSVGNSSFRLPLFTLLAGLLFYGIFVQIVAIICNYFKEP